MSEVAFPPENTLSGKDLRRSKKVLLFSPDLHLCASFTLLLQDRFKVVTTTEGDFVEKILDLIKPDLLITDLSPNEKSADSLRALKEKIPNLKIILFLDSWITNKGVESSLNKIVDAIFYQPIDLTEINRRLDFLMS
ncbi:MAG: hypothetical protein FJ213_10730 [Ignavibacteria bacterium]|nr:hypothetical protein [Ignavibacteria bacterium]